MKKKLRVLHIASFIGNIGDNANHIGAKVLRDKYLDFEFDITKKEIREFYWKEWKFNSKEFIEEANNFDLILIGGGNYFELWVENSSTGTSIDINIETLEKINPPIIFYSLGCDMAQGVPEGNKEKFKGFLDYLCNKEKYFVSVRNDGALENINKLFKDRYKNKIVKIPDGGFFIDIEERNHPEIDKDKKNILINLAGDMIDVRFDKAKGHISYPNFLNNFRDALENLNLIYDGKVNFIFVPHIFRDIQIIFDVINNLNDKLRRTNVKVAPYLSGDAGFKYTFSLYQESDLVLGMRFHSNVCSYALEKNIIGLCNYDQIENLYKDINSEEYIKVNLQNFSNELITKIREHLDNDLTFKEYSIEVKRTMLSNAIEKYSKLNHWLEKNFGGKNG